MSEFTTNVPVSLKASRTHNPIRAIVDNLKPPLNHPLEMMNLALGDPTAYGNLRCPPVLMDAVRDGLETQSCNGYLPSTGLLAARKAIAATVTLPDCRVTEDDVIIASGCSGALELAISVLVNEGDNILSPRPGFPLYQVIADSLGGSVQYYNLIPESGWECDLEHMASLVNARTRAIVLTNPSNPCGSNYSAEHLADLAALARKFNLPIIADEIYGGCVFDGVFTSVSSVSGDVPVIVVGGMAKEFVVPGWRVGWISVVDRSSKMIEVKAGLKSLSQLILGACSLIQQAIPRVLTPAPGSNDEVSLQEFNNSYMELIRTNSELCMTEAANIPELTAIPAKGAMYVMIRVDIDKLSGFRDDTDFCARLLMEQNVFVLPGQCFGMPNYFRLVTCPPSHLLQEAWDRLGVFCAQYRL